MGQIAESNAGRAPAGGVDDVSPERLQAWMRDGEAVVIDVREDFERQAERIAGSKHVPLGQLDVAALRTEHPDARIVFQCRTGRRSRDAAEEFMAHGGEGFHLGGGIVAWKDRGLPVERTAGAPRIDIMRQVQITAGSLVVLGVLLGVLVSPWALALSAFVGGGLIFAGASGWCGMAKLLTRMPWNRI